MRPDFPVTRYMIFQGYSKETPLSIDFWSDLTWPFLPLSEVHSLLQVAQPLLERNGSGGSCQAPDWASLEQTPMAALYSHESNLELMLFQCLAPNENHKVWYWRFSTPYPPLGKHRLGAPLGWPSIYSPRIDSIWVIWVQNLGQYKWNRILKIVISYLSVLLQLAKHYTKHFICVTAFNPVVIPLL